MVLSVFAKIYLTTFPGAYYKYSKSDVAKIICGICCQENVPEHQMVFSDITHHFQSFHNISDSKLPAFLMKEKKRGKRRFRRPLETICLEEMSPKRGRTLS